MGIGGIHSSSIYLHITSLQHALVCLCDVSCVWCVCVCSGVLPGGRGKERQYAEDSRRTRCGAKERKEGVGRAKRAYPNPSHHTVFSYTHLLI